jgi:5-methylcytosine-specific restriction protein A
MAGLRAKKPCKKQGCPALVGDEGYCEKHTKFAPKPWRSQGSVYKTGKTGSTTERGYGWQWQKKRKLVLNDNPFCVIAKVCVERYGHQRPSDCVDHVIPIAAGGTDDYDNLRGSCTDCNEWKARTLDRQLVQAAQRKS